MFVSEVIRLKQKGNDEFQPKQFMRVGGSERVRMRQGEEIIFSFANFYQKWLKE